MAWLPISPGVSRLFSSGLLIGGVTGLGLGLWLGRRGRLRTSALRFAASAERGDAAGRHPRGRRSRVVDGDYFESLQFEPPEQNPKPGDPG